MIVRNKGTRPVVITSNWEADPNGGPATNRTEYMIMPDGKSGIDLDIVGLVSEEFERLKSQLALANEVLETLDRFLVAVTRE